MQHITFEGVSFNVDFITKDMAKDFRYAHIWHDQPNRNELFEQLYNLTHEDEQQPTSSTTTTGYTASSGECDVRDEGGLCSNTEGTDASR